MHYWTGGIFRRTGLPLLAACLFAFAPIALAGFHVEQKVSYSGSAKGDAGFSWSIGDREFRLDVKRGADVKNFVFNGRTFYVCGKLDAAQLTFLKSLKIDDKKLMQNLSTGACQELAADFGAKFFLSPFDAVADVQVSGGFGSSIALGDSTIELAGSVQAVQNNKCVDFSRNYKVGDKTNAKSELTLSEKACNAPTIKWRQAFVRELGMAMIRQPGGQKNFQALNADLKKMSGLTLAATGQASGTGADGKTFSRTYGVTTSKVLQTELKPAELGLPSGFEVIDPKNLAGLAKPKIKGSAAKEKDGPDTQDVLRALILGASPVGGLFGN